MASTKRPDKKTTEQLLQDLENYEVVQPKRVKNEDDIVAFLRFYNIEDGPSRIPSKTLYNLYKKSTTKPSNEATFNLRIGKYLLKYQIRANVYYKINQKTINLSEKALELLKPKREKTKNHFWKIHFENFIKKFNLKSGKETHFIWVSIAILFDLYDEWTYEIKRNSTLNIKVFSEFCRLYFPKTTIKDRKTWFCMDETIKETLTEERIARFEARKQTPDEKKKSKKHIKVPSSTPRIESED